MDDQEKEPDAQPGDPEPTRDDGVLTPTQIVQKHRGRRAGLGSRTGLRNRLRADLEAYHKARGWDKPSDEKVEELVRDVLA